MHPLRRTTIKRRPAIVTTRVKTPYKPWYAKLILFTWPFIKALLRHPAFLVILGFLLTNILATKYTRDADEHQKKIETTVRNYDQLRSAIDDLRSSFELYATASLHATLALQLRPSAIILQQAYRDYQSAYSTWAQHQAVDFVSIDQRYILNSSGRTISKIGMLLYLGTEMMDNCMQTRFSINPIKTKDTPGDLICPAKPRLPSFNAMSRLMNLRFCVDAFARAIRPYPQLDLESNIARDAALDLNLKDIDTYCSPERLTGIKMPLREVPGNVSAVPKSAN